jgi:Cu2+-exporting ATPase
MKTDAQVKCLHCGTLFTPKSGEEYCCQGYAYVARLRRENGFEHFYELRGGKALPPAGSRVFPEVDFHGCRGAVREVEAPPRVLAPAATFRNHRPVLLCCVWNVEKLFRSAGPGGLRDPHRRSVPIASSSSGPRGASTPSPSLNSSRSMLARLQPMEQRENVGEAPSSRLALRVGLCGAFVLNTMLFTLPVYVGLESTSPLAPLFHGLAAVFATASMLVGGSYFSSARGRPMGLGVIPNRLPIALGLWGYGGLRAGWATAMGAGPLLRLCFDLHFLMLGRALATGYTRWTQPGHLDKQDSRAPHSVRAAAVPRRRENCPVRSCNAGQDYVLAPGEVNPSPRPVTTMR